jgi:alkanesulfonate monooxygenase SsuD/methylene tetrahydromethanopterin reductase-like flavin-dependent oxidoreductase (luciferase family)
MEAWLFNILPWPYNARSIPNPFPGAMFDVSRASYLYAEGLAINRRADELGFDGICCAEHHYGTTAMVPSPNLTAAALATQTSHAKIVLMGNCLPLHAHPVRLAEELAMIDVLSGGRLVSGFLRGGAREYGAYGIDIGHGRGMFQEAWDLIIRAWTDDEPFAWHGEHYDYDVVSILPRPLQRPHPPIVMGANSAESIEWGAEHHVTLITSHSPTSQIADTLRYFKQYAHESCGWTPEPADMGFSRHVYVSTSDAKAREECGQHALDAFRAPDANAEGRALRELNSVRNTERSFAYKSAPHVHRPLAGEARGYDQLVRDGYLIAGSPDTVIRSIQEQAKELGGPGVFISYLPFGSMEPDQTRACLELFGREVLPHVQKL